MKVNRNMKKTLLLTLTAGLISASPLAAADLFITGSTAFRASCHDACLKLFDSAPTEFTGTPATGGDSKTGNAAAQWVMTGPVGTKVTSLGNSTLTIHGLFTGSIQGIQTTEQGTKLLFLAADGVHILTNTPTIGFSDASGASSPFPATGNFSEEQVCVQPFTMTKSVAGGVMNSITNVTWNQLKSMIPVGRLPLSSWTTKTNDHNTFIYLLQRTKDSGTRRCETAQEFYNFNSTVTVYNYDVINNLFYKATNILNTATGLSGFGVVGPPGNNNANLSAVWGPGYVGGGDVRSALQANNAANLSMSYLSIADAKTVTGVNWSQVMSFEGLWPTAAGPGISGNTSTNNYSPITTGFYPCWGYEVLVYPNIDPNTIAGHEDQNLTQAQLGNQTTSGTILGVLDAQTLFNGGSPLPGSIENEIELSKPTGATAIRLSDMVSSRAFDGGPITP